MSNDELFEALKKLSEARAEDEKELDAIVETCDNEMKIAITRWVMRNIVEHALEGGSYRYLIYDRLGFGPEAYAPLCGDGLTISNEFDLNLKGEIRKVAMENGYDKIKPIIDLCDEPGCYEEASCGFPTEDGYRRTCTDHSKF